MSVGISISEGGIAIIPAKAGLGPDEESAVRLQLMPPVIGRVEPRDITTQRHGQGPAQEAGEVHLACGVRVVEGREYEVRDRHAIDVVAIDSAGIAHFNQVVNLLTGGVRIEVRGLGDAGARRVNQLTASADGCPWSLVCTPACPVRALTMLRGNVPCGMTAPASSTEISARTFQAGAKWLSTCC
jgi:hypothetical protein